MVLSCLLAHMTRRESNLICASVYSSRWNNGKTESALRIGKLSQASWRRGRDVVTIKVSELSAGIRRILTSVEACATSSLPLDKCRCVRTCEPRVSGAHFIHGNARTAILRVCARRFYFSRARYCAADNEHYARNVTKRLRFFFFFFLQRWNTSKKRIL